MATAPLTPPALDHMILTLRGHRVILDADLAMLYGVTTKALNQAIKRNPERFPGTFRFALDAEEFTYMRSQFVTASRKRNIRHLPAVFTEHGALMAATVLNSPQAVKMSIALIESFVRLRQEFATSQVLTRRLAEIERTVIHHDAALKDLFRAIKPLLLPPPAKPRRKMGFTP